MVWCCVLVLAVLTQADPRAAARGALPALLALLPTMLSPGLSTMHFLPSLHREWIRAAASLMLVRLGIAGGLGSAAAGFVLPALAGCW